MPKLRAPLLALVLLAGCTTTVQPPRRPLAASPSVAAHVAAASEAPLLEPPSSTPAAVPTTRATPVASGRLQQLVDALNDAVAGARASRMAHGFGFTSGLIGNLGTTLISDNGSSLLSNNGGGIISDNGGGLLSNNGGSLTGKTKYRLADAAASPAYEPGYPIASDVADNDTFYHISVESLLTGFVMTYDLARYQANKAATIAAGPIDHFTWSTVDLHFVDTAQGLVDVVVPLHKVKSDRLPFLDDLTSVSHRKYADAASANAGSDHNFDLLGLELDFAMAFPLVPGLNEQAHFRAVSAGADLQVTPGSDGMLQAVPRAFQLTGSNYSGTYSGTMSYGADVTTTLTHTGLDGTTSTVSLGLRPDGGYVETVTSQDAKLSVKVDVPASGAPSGQVFDGETAVGTLAVDADGLAQLSLASGQSATARLR